MVEGQSCGYRQYWTQAIDCGGVVSMNCVECTEYGCGNARSQFHEMLKAMAQAAAGQAFGSCRAGRSKDNQLEGKDHFYS